MGRTDPDREAQRCDLEPYEDRMQIPGERQVIRVEIAMTARHSVLVRSEMTPNVDERTFLNPEQ